MRRPIATRERAWAHALAGAAVRVGLAPNTVSCLSVVCAAAAGAALALSAQVNLALRIVLLLVAAVAIQLRLLCNMLDGLMAVEGGLKTRTGELYNDLPDRLADALIFMGAGYAVRHFWFGIELGWLVALLAVMTAYVRVVGAAAGARHSFIGPMAKQHRMAIMTVACLSATVEPWLDLNGEIIAAALIIIAVGCVITMVRRLRLIARELENQA